MNPIFASALRVPRQSVVNVKVVADKGSRAASAVRRGVEAIRRQPSTKKVSFR